MTELHCDICNKKVGDLHTIVKNYSVAAGVNEACDKCLHELENEMYEFRKIQKIEREKHFAKTVSKMQGIEYTQKIDDDFKWYLSPMLWLLATILTIILIHTFKN